jgi:hypothetical protein
MIMFAATYDAHARHLAALSHRDGNAVVNDLCIDDLAIKIVQICQLCGPLRSRNLLCQFASPVRCCCAALHLACTLDCPGCCFRQRTMARCCSGGASELTAGQAGVEGGGQPRCGAARRRGHSTGRHLCLRRAASGHKSGLLRLHLHCFLGASVAMCLWAHKGSQ